MAKVTRLPSAAPRKVDNLRYAAQRQAVREARAANPWRGEYKFPFDRKREARDSQLARLRRSPELVALLAIMTAFPEDRLDALEAAANLLELHDPESEDAQLGAFLVREAVTTRRAMTVLAKIRN